MQNLRCGERGRIVFTAYLGGGAQQQASRPSLTDQGRWIASTACGPADLARFWQDGGQGLQGTRRAGVLPCYLLACMLATGTCHVLPHDSGDTTWEKLRVHLALDECDSTPGVRRQQGDTR